MSMAPAAGAWRLPAGGRVDRGRPLRFRFNGADYQALHGDTLASALLANGVRLVGRSFKYHRPRGILAAGAEECNALVQLVRPYEEPNVQATRLTVVDGLEASSVNCWPSVERDLGAIASLMAPLLPAGFYYKTFMALPWNAYGRCIRAMAGLGRLPAAAPEPERCEKRFDHFDVVVVGAGAAGLAAAETAANAGLRVLLADDQPEPGGSLLERPATIDGRPALDWVASLVARLDARDNVLRLASTTVIGYHDHNLLTMVEHAPAQAWVRERLRRVRAGAVILATGAIERPLVFADNDRPGIMLAGAIGAYLHRYAVRAGSRAVLVTNNSSVYPRLTELLAGGIAVAAVVDTRAAVPEPARRAAAEAGVDVHAGCGVRAVIGRRRLRAIVVAPRGGGPSRTLGCDLIGMSGGFNPTVHLHSQSGARPRFDALRCCFVPGPPVQTECSAGAARGLFRLDDCVADGAAAGRQAAAGILSSDHAVIADLAPRESCLEIEPCWELSCAGGSDGKAFVDFQNDVTSADLRLAVRENYAAIEHVKRYTTAGMATDQGKTGNVNVIGIVAEGLGLDPGALGTTTFRPPYRPVHFAALAGGDGDRLVLPARHTPLTAWHVAAGAHMDEAGGQYRRPFYYPAIGESMAAAVDREARAARTAAAIYDSSPLGKFQLTGADVVTFLERIYTNRWADLAVGRGRFGLMLREDGRLFDDGITFRIDSDRYLMSTGTGAAQAVHAHMERLLQCEWLGLQVFVTPVTGHWADICVCGPKAREVLRAAGADLDLSPVDFRFMDIRPARLGATPVRIARVGYTGELSFEIYVRSRDAAALWQRLLDAGREYGITPIGSETSSVLRIEKGFVAPAIEGDHRTNPFDAGLERFVDMDKPDFVGRRSLVRDLRVGGPRHQVVGLLPVDPAVVPADGSVVVERHHRRGRAAVIGHLTASCFSPNLGRSIALALVQEGRARYGDRVDVCAPGQRHAAILGAPVFLDAAGERMRG